MAKGKYPHAVALGRRGGLAAAGKAQAARWAGVSPEELTPLARKAAAARWAKKKQASKEL